MFLVERFRAGGQHLLRHSREPRMPFFLHARDGLLNADRVPGFKRPQLPTKAPAHRAIDFHDVVGNLRNVFRGVSERARHRLPKKRAHAILAPNQCFDTLRQVFDILRHVERGKFHLLRRPISSVACRSPKSLFYRLRLSAFCRNRLWSYCRESRAQPFALEIRAHEHVALFIFRQGFVKVLDDMGEHVETDQIKGAESCRLRPPTAGPVILSTSSIE